MKRIFIRCDGGNIGEFGTGHVSRMLVLAYYLKKKIKDLKIIFLTRKEKKFKLGYEIIKNKKFKIYNCKDSDLIPNSNNEMKIFKYLESDLIIIDRLSLSKKISKFLSNLKKKYIVFDSKKNKFIKNNQIFNLDNLNKKKVSSKNFQHFIPNPKLRFKNFKNKYNLFICFGGVDKKKYSIKIVKNFNLFKNFKKIYLITREKQIYKSLIKIIQKERKNNLFNIYCNPVNFYEILNKCKYSLTSGGLTFIDSVISGSNTLAVPQYSHQIRNINFFNSIKLMPYKISQMEKFDSKKITKIITLLRNDKNFKNQKSFAKNYFKLNRNLKIILTIKKLINDN